MATPSVGAPAVRRPGLAAPAATATRLISLDVFRGATMAAMVVVNNPGDWGNVYWPLLHAEWNGWTPTDLIFPFFLFIVGVSITLSRKSTSWGAIVRRSALIIGLGLFLAGYPRFDVTRWRIPGVLQRIGVCYLAAASLFHLTRGDRRRQGAIVLSIGVALAVAYWLVMMLVPPPGGIAGDLTADGNLGAYVDRALMLGHTWKPRWDPEGLLSTIPAISTTLFGIAVGLCLGSSFSPERKAAALAAFGVAGIVAGEIWNIVFPINKNLWTSSYAVFMAGAAALLLALCYWVIDVKGWRGWTKPFVILGTNAITLFAASALLVKTMALIKVAGPDGAPISISRYAYLHYFVPFAAPKNASLLYALANLVVLFALLAWMYRRRIFVRL